MEPRHFLRRFAAFLVDLVLAAALSIALVFPLLSNTDQVRLGSVGLVRQQCQDATQVPQVLHDLVAPKALNRVVICQNTVWGINNGLTAKLIFDTQTVGAATLSRSMIVPIDGAGLPVAPWEPQDVLTLLILILGGAALLTAFGKTPGKWLFGLHVIEAAQAEDLGASVSAFRQFGRALQREILRAGPLILVTALSSRYFLGNPAVASAMATGPIYSLLAALLALFAWHYLWPFLRWTGATPWDRKANLALTRS